MNNVARLETSKITLLYSSCEKYSILLPSFFELFEKNFYRPEKCVSTLGSDFRFRGIFIQGIGEKNQYKDFSSRLIAALAKVRTPYLLFMLDDFFLFEKVQIDVVCKAFAVLKADPTIGYVLLQDTRPIDDHVPYGQTGFYLLKPYTNFRISTQAAIWSTRYLKKLLRRGESAWDFEDLASRRSNHYSEKLLFAGNLARPVFPYPIGGILWRGAINCDAIKLLKENGFEQLLDAFPINEVNPDLRLERQKKESQLSRTRRRVLAFKRAVIHLYVAISVLCKFVRFPSSLSLWK